MKEDINYIELFRNKVKIIITWYKNGDFPPDNISKTIFLTLLLSISGFYVILNLTLNNFDSNQKFPDIPKIPLIIYSLITIFPGLWIFWISICCWRRIDGYDWWMIPHFI